MEEAQNTGTAKTQFWVRFISNSGTLPDYRTTDLFQQSHIHTCRSFWSFLLSRLGVLVTKSFSMLLKDNQLLVKMLKK